MSPQAPTGPPGGNVTAMPPGPPPLNATLLIQQKGMAYLQDYKGYQLRDVAIAFFVLNTIAVGLRFISRIMTRSRLLSDDWLIIPAYLCSIGLCIQAIAMVNYGGAGWHIERVMLVEPTKLTATAKFLVVGPLLFFSGIMFAKLSILCVYLRFLSERPFRIACYVLMALTIGLSGSVMIAALVQCVPLKKLWTPTMTTGECGVNTNSLFLWPGVPNIVIDCFMLILPIPYVWKLPANRVTKISLVATIATGSIGLITAIVRFAIFSESDAVSDGTRTAVLLVSFTILEVAGYLFASCLLTYRPLLNACRHRLGFQTAHPDSAVDSSGSARRRTNNLNSTSGGTGSKSMYLSTLEASSERGYQISDVSPRDSKVPWRDEAMELDTRAMTDYDHGRALGVESMERSRAAARGPVAPVELSSRERARSLQTISDVSEIERSKSLKSISEMSA